MLSDVAATDACDRRAGPGWAGRESIWTASTRRMRMAGWGTWVPSRQASAGLEPVAQRRIGVDQVEASVAGMGPWGDVPVTEERGVGGDDDPAAQPRSASDEVGEEPVEPSVDEHGAEIDADMGALRRGRSRRPAQCAGEVAAR